MNTAETSLYKRLPLKFNRLPETEMAANSKSLLHNLKKRRTVRDFSSENIPQTIIENCIKAAATAPSGANCQPWYFVLIKDPKVKNEIREAAEAEEKEFYEYRAPQEWLDALKPFDTDCNKPFLEEAPWIIAVFAKNYDISPEGRKSKNYYVSESVGIACGMLITALHLSGLATLTHTPSPMKFLNKILSRPPNEKPYMLIVTGYPKEKTSVPAIDKKTLKEIMTIF